MKLRNLTFLLSLKTTFNMFLRYLADIINLRFSHAQT